MATVRCDKVPLDGGWLLLVNGVLDAHLAERLRDLGAVIIRDDFWAASSATTREDFQCHLADACVLYVQGAKVDPLPDDACASCGHGRRRHRGGCQYGMCRCKGFKAKEATSNDAPHTPPPRDAPRTPPRCRAEFWRADHKWHVLLERDADDFDDSVMGLIFRATRIGTREYFFDVASPFSAETDVFSTLKGIYDARERKAQEQTPPKSGDDTASRGDDTARKAYEHWCRVNGVEPFDGKWRTDEGPPGSGGGSGNAGSSGSAGYSGNAGSSGSAGYTGSGGGWWYEDFFPGYKNRRYAPPPPPRRPEPTDPYRAMLEGLPHATLKKIYRLIAVEHHPDKGGDGEVLKRVNAAWDRIQKLLGLA